MNRDAKSVSSRDPTEAHLLAALAKGDADALRALIRRYDRLVRYTIHRATPHHCRKDPQWLDSVATDTWAGFVRSMQRGGSTPVASVCAYLVRTAKNQCATALRRLPASEAATELPDDDSAHAAAAHAESPADTLAGIEELEALRDCVSRLNADEAAMLSQLTAITERRWRDAAAGLGMPESTLRSRWKEILDQLRRLMREKTRRSLAPDEGEGDL